MPPKRQKRTRPGNINPKYSRLPKPRPPDTLDESKYSQPILPRQPWLKKLHEREIGYRRSTEPIVFQKLRHSRTENDWNPHHIMKTFGEFQEQYAIPATLLGPNHARTQTYDQWYDEVRALKAYNKHPRVTPINEHRLATIEYPRRHMWEDMDRIVDDNLPWVGYQVHPINPAYKGRDRLHINNDPDFVDDDLKKWNPVDPYQPSEDAPYVIE